MRTPPRSLLARLALALLAVQLTVALPWALLRSAREAWHVIVYRHETPFQQRVRTFGLSYTEAVERIRRTIPQDGAYVLINGNPGEEEGGPIWVKFDLAPRRAVYLGKLRDLQDADRLRRRMPRAAHWVVVVDSNEPPVLFERYRFIQQIRERQGG